MAIKDNSNAAQEVSDQAEYNHYLMEAPIAESAKYFGVGIDEAVNRRVEAVKASAPLKLDVSVRPIEPKGNLLGFASLRINGGFVVDDLKVLQGEKGLFVGMPSKPDGKGGYRDTARPVTKDSHAALTGAVTRAYREAVEKLQSLAPESVSKQLSDGAAKAAKDNAARPAVAKSNKNKNAEK